MELDLYVRVISEDLLKFKGWEEEKPTIDSLVVCDAVFSPPIKIVRPNSLFLREECPHIGIRFHSFLAIAKLGFRLGARELIRRQAPPSHFAVLQQAPMNRSMSSSHLLLSLCILVAVIGLCFPVARSERAAVIQQVTAIDGGEEGGHGDVCGTLAAVAASCPVNCFRANPVCGVDGVTYWCGCPDAMCNGTKVANLGACEVGSGGSSSLHGQALLLVHIVWLFLLGFSLLFGLF